MPGIPELSELGHISGVYGYSGGLKIIVSVDDSPSLRAGDWVFLIIEKKPVPFEVVAYHGTSIDLQGVSSVEEARNFRGVTIMVPTSKFLSQGKKTTIGFKNWRLYDDTSFLGTVVHVEKSAMSVVLHVKLEDGREILLPYHEDLVIEAIGGTLRMNVPDGLLDL